MMILFWLVWAVSTGVVVFVVGKCLWDFFKWLMPSLRAWKERLVGFVEGVVGRVVLAWKLRGVVKAVLVWWVRSWWRRRKNSSAFKKYMSDREGVGRK